MCVCVLSVRQACSFNIRAQSFLSVSENTKKKFRITLQHPANGFYYYNIFFNVSNMQIIFFLNETHEKNVNIPFIDFFCGRSLTYDWHTFFSSFYTNVLYTQESYRIKLRVSSNIIILIVILYRDMQKYRFVSGKKNWPH